MNFTSPLAPVSFPTIQAAGVNAIQPDGKILIVLFTNSSGFTNYTLRRLNPNGSFDTTFNAANVGGGRLISQRPVKVLLLPNGKILVATNTFNGMGSSSSFLRFNADGTPDATFEAPSLSPVTNSALPGTLVNDLELLADGSLIIVGKFAGVNGISRQNIAKFLLAGNVDLNFNPPNSFQNDEPANGVEVYSNGKILVGTGVVFNPLGPPGTTNRFVQFNSDGSLDNTFVSPANLVLIKQFEIDNADTALVFGIFTENGVTANRFARLNQNGTIGSYLDLTFGVGASITSLGLQPDGKILFAGDFV